MIILALLAGAACGVGQFFILRYTLKPLAEGKPLRVGLGMLLRLPIPLILLLGYAWYDTNLLPFAGISFCVSVVAVTAIHQIISSKKGD